MAERRSERQKAAPGGPYRHLVGGEVDGRPHEAGDRVDPKTPASKLREWLEAGVIEPAKRSEKRSKEERGE